MSADPWFDQPYEDGGPETKPAVKTVTTSAPERGQWRMARRMALSHAHKLRHVHGLGWFYYDGKRWTEDDRGRAMQAVEQVLRAASNDGVKDSDQALIADVRKCTTAQAYRGILDLAASFDPFAVTVRDLDPDPYLLNCSNGTLDLRTLDMKDHAPGDLITKVTGAAFDPSLLGPTWQGFLDRVLPKQDVRAFLQRYVGTALCGRVLEHKLAILTGTGRNGKGVFYGAVAAALGDYASTAEPDLFMHRDGAHPTGEMDLRGLRWVVVSESDKGRKLAEATVKRLTGGDAIRARKMRQDFVQFDPSHTAALVTNHLPKVSGDDPALWARLRVVPFDVVLPKAEQDPHLPERLALEASAVLSWIVAGWDDYNERGALDEPEGVLAATESYHADSDAVARFVAAECVELPNVHGPIAALWSAWTSWCTAEGVEPMSKQLFGEALDKRGHEAAKGSKGVRIRRGIAVAQQPEDDD